MRFCFPGIPLGIAMNKIPAKLKYPGIKNKVRSAVISLLVIAAQSIQHPHIPDPHTKLAPQKPRIPVLLRPEPVQYISIEAAVNGDAFVSLIFPFITEVDHQDPVFVEPGAVLFVVSDEPLGEKAVVLIHRKGEEAVIGHGIGCFLVAALDSVAAHQIVYGHGCLVLGYKNKNSGGNFQPVWNFELKDGTS